MKVPIVLHAGPGDWFAGVCVNACFHTDPMLREDVFSLCYMKKAKKYMTM